MQIIWLRDTLQSLVRAGKNKHTHHANISLYNQEFTIYYITYTMNIELPPTIFHDLVLLLIDRLKIVQNRFAKTTKSLLMYVNLVKKIWRGKSVCLNLLFVHEFIAGWWRRNSYQSWNKSSCIVFFLFTPQFGVLLAPGS